jgi:hypothetical protein
MALPAHVLAAGLVILTAAGSCRPGSSVPPTQAAAPAKGPDEATRLRHAALARARVWNPPAQPIGLVDLGRNPSIPGGFADDAEVDCRFKLREAGGTTPKFYCDLPDGTELKIKYGAGNPEGPAEVAASRLLAALGFGADRMLVVRRVRCAGCPTFPFESLRCYERIGLPSVCFFGGIDFDRVVDFDAAVVERKLEGRVIEGYEDQGWAWFELDRIDPDQGGSTRAEVDAFRLMAVFLAHWDNKAGNQRLICPPASENPDRTCRQPLAFMQDLGATFGPLKIDLHHWRRGRIWKDGASCTVSMEHLPWQGATFPERRISEDGRLMLLGLLDQLSSAQLRALFEGARVTSLDHFTGEARQPEAWVRAFNERIDQIRKGGPCAS